MDDKSRTADPHGHPELQWSLPQELLQLAQETGAEMILELLAIFQEDSASRLKTLRAAIEEGEPGGIRSQAHSLKGSAAQVGAMGMAESCREMEQLAQGRSKPDQLALLSEIEARFAQVCELLSSSDVAAMLSQPEIRS